ncbi:hotdog fold domain-containing protein [Clostridium aestuarii]|uniref:Hotdog fold domain-containing protein n=1 Tax=Clostridium aestuarii TaxID=338193 RepID=A0ABT4D111_9CLOT|nr:hotdog fold domain-containing protein [Clostridium aestuarii]MCY6484312.1 hotdog fold domain-containing protein [Clostridium aestuarii]
MAFVKPEKNYETMIRVRMSSSDAHYAGELVNGSRTIEYMGDVSTELMAMHDGNEGQCIGYEKISFTAPTYAGDFIEVAGRIIGVEGNKRKVQLRAFKIAGNAGLIKQNSAVDVYEDPVMTLETIAIYEVPAK